MFNLFYIIVLTLCVVSTIFSFVTMNAIEDQQRRIVKLNDVVENLQRQQRKDKDETYFALLKLLKNNSHALRFIRQVDEDVRSMRQHLHNGDHTVGSGSEDTTDDDHHRRSLFATTTTTSECISGINLRGDNAFVAMGTTGDVRLSRTEHGGLREQTADQLFCHSGLVVAGDVSSPNIDFIQQQCDSCSAELAELQATHMDRFCLRGDCLCDI